jgi:hypothetical protein
METAEMAIMLKGILIRELGGKEIAMERWFLIRFACFSNELVKRLELFWWKLRREFDKIRDSIDKMEWLLLLEWIEEENLRDNGAGIE